MPLVHLCYTPPDDTPGKEVAHQYLSSNAKMPSFSRCMLLLILGFSLCDVHPTG